MTDKPIKCQSCPRKYERGGQGSLEDRARAAGWIVWEGVTIGGEQVRRVFCTGCLSRAEEGPLAPRWDARCRTCDWSASEEDGYEDSPFNEEDARAWKWDHRCEPDVELIEPEPEQVAREQQRLENLRSLAALAGAA